MELELRLARLETTVRDGFKGMRSEFARQERNVQQRHRENIEARELVRLELAQQQQNMERAREVDNKRTDEAHTKVDKLDQAVVGAWKEIVRIRENYHQLRNWITGVHPEQAQTLPPAKEAREPMATGDNRPVTQSDLKWIIGLIITCLGAGAAITLWILKVSGAFTPKG